jgi:hypothetical protein
MTSLQEFRSCGLITTNPSHWFGGESAAARSCCAKLECDGKQLIINEIVVEAAGVEPASENVTGQENYMLSQFMPWALPQDVRGPRSEPTRNACR